MNKQQLAMLEDISNKLEKRTSDQGARAKVNELKDDGGMYNPIVHLELSQFKKHNSLAPLRKDASNIEYNKPSEEVHKGEFIVIKAKKKEDTVAAHKEKKPDEKSEEEKKKAETPKLDHSAFLKRLEDFLDSTPIIIIMTTFTIFCLFASDIQSSCLPVTVDLGFDVTQIVLLLFFTLEVVLCSIAKKNYVGTFFFWLDVIATLSLLQDITLIFDNLLTGNSSLSGPTTFSNITSTVLDNKSKYDTEQAAAGIQKVSSASRATRVLRIIRIIRLIRMVKLYKSAVLARANMDRKKKEKERMKSYNQMMEQQVSYEESIKSKNSDGQDPIIQDGEMNSPDKKVEIEPNTVVRLKDGNNNRKASRFGGHSKLELFYFFNFFFNNPLVDLNKLRNEDKKTKLDSNRAEDKNKARKKKLKISKTFVDNTPIDQLINESKISKILSESITKKVIILIMVMLIILPILQDDFYQDDSTAAYLILAKIIDTYWSVYGADDFVNPSQYPPFLKKIEDNVDPNFPIIAIKIEDTYIWRNSSLTTYEYRYSEIKEVVSEDGKVKVSYSNTSDTILTGYLNIGRTLFVCMCLALAAIYFEKDTQELVLQPLEIMMEIVDNVAKDPINAKNVESLQKGVKSTMNKMGKKGKKGKREDLTEEKYEIKVIESAIIKISALLAIGFGEAGGEIIKENLSSNSELNPMLKGKKTTAIFGFCDIRNFPIVNDALQERTMVFVNEIADIVHSSVDTYGGAANKNIGDAFLMVWKFKNDPVLGEDQKDPVAKLVKDNLVEQDPDNPIVQRTADMSVLGFLGTLIGINKDLRVLAYRTDPDIALKLTNYKVKMGFGLHLGWAIEGAIGSSYKIDASYLSPNVNMSARLEAATRIYGVNILLSGPLYDRCSDEIKEICRLIDVVTVKGSVEPMRLYTIDLNLNITPQKVKVSKNQSTKAKRSKHEENKKKILKEGKDCGSVARYVLGKKSYREILNSGRSKKFYANWREGLEHYFKGRWEEAGRSFSECLRMVESDGPCNTLLGVLKANNYTAPKKWEGVRELTSKT